MLDFIDIKLIDIIDVILVALLVYYIYKLIRGTAAISIFSGIIVIYVVWIVVNALNMSLLSAILGQILGVGDPALPFTFGQQISERTGEQAYCKFYFWETTGGDSSRNFG